MRLRLIAAALASSALVSQAHPAALECATDAATRLQVGKLIMGSTTVKAANGADGVEVRFRFSLFVSKHMW